MKPLCFFCPLSDCYATFHLSFSFHCFTLTAGFDALALLLQTHAGGCFESLYLARIRAIRRYEPSAFVEGKGVTKRDSKHSPFSRARC